MFIQREKLSFDGAYSLLRFVHIGTIRGLTVCFFLILPRAAQCQVLSSSVWRCLVDHYLQCTFLSECYAVFPNFGCNFTLCAFSCTLTLLNLLIFSMNPSLTTWTYVVLAFETEQQHRNVLAGSTANMSNNSGLPITNDVLIVHSNPLVNIALSSFILNVLS